MNKKEKNKNSISQLDLNLLKIFRVLAEEQKTVLAAKRLNMTQPAVSRALSRLRDHFDDELFVRTRHGLKPTDKGQLLADKLPDVMDDLSRLILELNDFDPGTCTAHLNIAINGFFGVFLPSRLYLRINALAPNVTLSVESWGPSTLSKLLNGELDLGISYKFDNFPKELVSRHLAHEHFQILARKGHPLEHKVVEIEDIAHYSIISAILPDWNEHTPHLAEYAKSRKLETNVAFRAESITSLLEVTAVTDYLFPTSMYLSENYYPNLTRLTLSDDLMNNFALESHEIAMYMHYRHRQSPMIKWLLPIIDDLISSNMHK